MRHISLAVLGIFATLATYAQISDAEADAVANLLAVQKKEAMAKLVDVSKKDSATFWKIYDEYQKLNIKTAKERLRLYEQTAAAYNNLTPAIADSLARRYFSNRLDQEKTLEDYYKKIKTATSPVVAFQFYQAEVYMITQIRSQIMQQIPTYGQVQLATKKKE
jgi:hypothetical protein